MFKATLARLALHGGAAALAAFMSPAQAGTVSRLNDTGMTQCAVWDDTQQEWIFTTHCKGTGQDPEYGRDAAGLPDDDGRAGFSFVKIGENGEMLPRTALT